jgi:hypothetical protein
MGPVLGIGGWARCAGARPDLSARRWGDLRRRNDRWGSPGVRPLILLRLWRGIALQGPAGSGSQASVGRLMRAQDSELDGGEAGRAAHLAALNNAQRAVA